MSDRPGSGTPRHVEYQTIVLEELDDGNWHATQQGVDVVGRGPNPGRAVANYGEMIAETAYEGGERRASD